MYLADYHLHSTCSPDGTCTMAQMARAAQACGLQEICITDHLDTIYWESFAPRTTFDWAESLRQLQEARSLCEDRLIIRRGAELGEAILSFDRAEMLLKNAPPLDFIIGSVHTAGEAFAYMDLYNLGIQEQGDYDAILRDYLVQTRKLITWGKFHVLGHFTLPLRYIDQHTGRRLSFLPYMDEVEDLLQLLIARGIGLELNTNRGDFPMPEEAILRRYRALGGECITLGSDAHAAQHVGRGIAACQALLRRCGFSYFTTYEQGRPCFHPLP